MSFGETLFREKIFNFNEKNEYIRPPKLFNLSSLFPYGKLKELQSIFLKSDLGLSEEEFCEAVVNVLGEGRISEYHLCMLFRQIDCFSRGRSFCD
jgi:hypothetical protein